MIRMLTEAAAATVICMGKLCAADTHDIPIINPDWKSSTGEVTTEISLQVCVEPPLRAGSPIKRALFKSLEELGANYARLQFYYPYPRLSVPELEPPDVGKAHWDFRLMDPIVASFYAATSGRPVVVDFSVLPEWMFKTAERVSYPADPNQTAWMYNQGVELRDPSLREIRGYYSRIASWYVTGGFVDELGKRYQSGYHYDISYWEVLNEIDGEHNLSPELYTRIYDEVVEEVKMVSPRTKFVGLALGDPSATPEYFEYFLNPRNHKPNVPLDMISYHFYATPQFDEPPEAQQFTFFRQVDSFISTVKYVESIRKRLSPNTKTYIDEVGTATAQPLSSREVIPPTYWHLSAAVFANLYVQLVKLHIELVGGAELIDYPGQFAGASLSDWTTGYPNARFQVLRLLRGRISRGDSLVDVDLVDHRGNDEIDRLGQRGDYSVQGFMSQEGERKVLIINKRDRPLFLRIVGAKGGRLDYVDESTRSGEPLSVKVGDDRIRFGGFSVAIVSLADSAF